MGQDEYPLPVPNRQLLRPRGWSPKLDLKASEMTEETREEHWFSLFSALAALGQKVEHCYRFYTDDPSVPWPQQPPPDPPFWKWIDSLQDFARHSLAQQARHWREWTPWTCEYGDLDLFDDLIPFVTDPELYELGQSIVDQWRIFLRVNEQLAQALAMFFGLPAPEVERDFQGLRAQAEEYRKQVGAAWTTDPELYALIGQLQVAVAS
jgi:hypothetical protein